MSAPEKIQHYELLSRLGEGGMGVVYRARDTRLGRIVALKVLPDELASDEDRCRRFELEARIASSLSHPGIATLYDVGRDGGHAFLTMELVEGETLRQILGRGPLPIRQVLDCAVQVAEALSAAHRAGVIHRDLKPENVMLSASGYYKVLDFGIARVTADRSSDENPTSTPTYTWRTRTGALVGTVAYMSPEQALGEPLDARSDLFSFGSVLYELITGTPAFRGATEIATGRAILADDPTPLARIRPDLPPGLDAVVRKCLAKEKDQRFAGADALAEDLRALRFDSLAGTRDRQQLHALAGSGTFRPSLRLATGASIALVALAAVAWLAIRSGAPARNPSSSVTGAEAAADFATLSNPVGPATLPPSLRPRRVVVAAFDNQTGAADQAWLARGLPEMLTTDLSGSDGLEVIATQRLHDLLAQAGKAGESLDRAKTTELARWAGADLVITGAIFRAGSRYRIDAQAYDTATGTVVVARKSEGTELFRMVDELSQGLREGLEVGGRAPGELQHITTASEPAYRAFVQGKTLYDGLRFDEAAQTFDEALRVDPSFALARLRLAMSLYMAGSTDQADAALDEAREQVDRMPEPSRLLTLGLHAFYRDRDPAGGGRYFETLARDYPAEKDTYAWWGRALGEVVGDSVASTQKLRKAMGEDPSDLPAIAVMAVELARLGARPDAERLLSEAARRRPEADAALERLRASLRGSVSAERE